MYSQYRLSNAMSCFFSEYQTWTFKDSLCLALIEHQIQNESRSSKSKTK